MGRSLGRIGGREGETAVSPTMVATAQEVWGEGRRPGSLPSKEDQNIEKKKKKTEWKIFIPDMKARNVMADPAGNPKKGGAPSNLKKRTTRKVKGILPKGLNPREANCSEGGEGTRRSYSRKGSRGERPQEKGRVRAVEGEVKEKPTIVEEKGTEGRGGARTPSPKRKKNQSAIKKTSIK